MWIGTYLVRLSFGSGGGGDGDGDGGCHQSQEEQHLCVVEEN